MAAESTFLTARAVTWTGLIANAVLAAAKLLAGIFLFSKAILADGLHSASDLVTDVAVLAGLRAAKRPADEDHPYGHHRVSTLVAMLVGAVLLASGGGIVYQAIDAIRHPAGHVRGPLPFWLAVISIPVKEVLYRLTRYVGRRTANVSLLANAWHHRTDAFTSLAAAAGLAGVTFGGPGWQFLDPLTAIVLSASLVVVAVRIIRASGSELIDRAPAEQVMACIRQAVVNTPGVRSFHSFRARQVGGKVVMDIHVQVDPDLTVRQGHDVASAVQERVTDSDCNVIEAVVHIEPTDEAEP